jgi:hypothetical protein
VIQQSHWCFQCESRFGGAPTNSVTTSSERLSQKTHLTCDFILVSQTVTSKVRLIMKWIETETRKTLLAQRRVRCGSWFGTSTKVDTIVTLTQLSRMHHKSPVASIASRTAVHNDSKPWPAPARCCLHRQTQLDTISSRSRGFARTAPTAPWSRHNSQ